MCSRALKSQGFAISVCKLVLQNHVLRSSLPPPPPSQTQSHVSGVSDSLATSHNSQGALPCHHWASADPWRIHPGVSEAQVLGTTMVTHPSAFTVAPWPLWKNMAFLGQRGQPCLLRWASRLIAEHSGAPRTCPRWSESHGGGRKQKGLALCGTPIYKNTLEGLQQFDLSRSSDLSVASSV